MPCIHCDAVKCVFNTHGGCSRNYVEILAEQNGRKGERATCCENFSDKISALSESSSTNGSPCSHTDIECNAEKCVYNDDRCCTAGNIRVGKAFSDSAGKTLCETFRVPEKREHQRSPENGGGATG